MTNRHIHILTYQYGIIVVFPHKSVQTLMFNLNTGRRCIIMGKNQYVVTSNGKWGVRGEGNSRLTAVYDNQADAIKTARQIAINQKSELFIQGRDGKFRDRNSYGNDPFPPRG